MGKALEQIFSKYTYSVVCVFEKIPNIINHEGNANKTQ